MDLYEKVEELHDYVLSSTRRHLEEGRIVVADVADDDVATNKAVEQSTNNNTPTTNTKMSRSSEGALDDTTGWRSLETGILAASGHVDGRSIDYIHDIVKRCCSSSQKETVDEKRRI